MQTVTRQGQCQQPKVEEAGGFFLNKKKFKGKKKPQNFSCAKRVQTMWKCLG